MSKWEKVRIDDVCIKKISTVSSKSEDLIDYIDISSVDSKNKRIVDYRTYRLPDAPSRAKQLLENNDIIISTVRPNLNAIAINNIESSNMKVASTGFCVLRCKEAIDVNYLFNFCKSSKFINGLVSVAKGASYPAVSNSQVRNVAIPLPPIEVQTQIAATLDAASELITICKQQLAELDELIKSVFYEMFGDPVTNEKGWEKGQIKDLSEKLQYGTSQKATLKETQYPILRMNNITYSGDMDFSDMKYIELDEKDIEKYLVHKGELLFNRTNSKELVGKTAVYREHKPMAYAGYLIKLTPNKSANSEFISGFLNSSYGKKLLYKMAKSIVGMANINAKELGSINIYIPPLELQNQFADIVTKIEEQKSLVKQAIDETQQLFDSLMSHYFDD